jgi:glycerol-3-phosphate acyltransferase PlsX
VPIDVTSSTTQRICVAIDAMGGDQAPQAIVAGTVAAARALPDIDTILVGDQSVIEPLLSTDRPANLQVQHASEVVEMCDAPGVAVRQKRDSSIAVGMRLVRDGQAQAMISAGNSGAMMAAGILILKAQRGIDRPAIATLLPTRRGQVVLLDSGATTDCKPAHLVHFACMGSIYAATVLDCVNPRVGLLSIGEEPTKGDELTKETHQLLLTTSNLNFVGNVEPKEMLRGDVDVVVCDGFVGNLMLKAGEGLGELIMNLISDEVKKNFFDRLLAGLLRPALRRVKKRFDYAEVGGALLLGVNGVVVIGHGRSNSLAITNAIRVAARAVQRDLAHTLGSATCEATPASS